jgi:hypothetical protein
VDSRREGGGGGGGPEGGECAADGLERVSVTD